MVLCLSFLTIPAKINAQVDISAKVSEVIGDITIYNKNDSTHSIVINNQTYLIDKATIIKTDLIKNARVRVQYKTGAKEGEKVATKIFENELFVPFIKLLIPIPDYIPPTAFSGIGMGDLSDLGKIKSSGFGGQVEIRAFKNINLILDFTTFSYNQVLAEEGETVPSHLDYGSPLTMPLGARYYASTSVIRIGFKYILLKDLNFNPWFGAGYGINKWNIEYLTYDSERSYGKDNGKVWRHYIQAGVDLKMDKVGILSMFFEAVSPVANYSIDDLYGEPYSSFEGMTYPTPRIGIMLTIFY